MNFNDYITPQERLAAIKRGLFFKLAEMTKDKSNNFSADNFKKYAQSGVTQSMWDAIRFIMLLGAGNGIPMGILLHQLGKRTATNRLSERELQEKAKLYRGLVGNLQEVEIPKEETEQSIGV